MDFINIKDGTPFKGVANQNFLAIQRYKSKVWGTYKNLKENGYQVRRGETGTRLLVPQFKKTEDQEEEVASFRTAIFFNIEQCDKIEQEQEQ